MNHSVHDIDDWNLHIVSESKSRKIRVPEILPSDFLAKLSVLFSLRPEAREQNECGK